MAHSFNWHKLPPDMRLGFSPDEELTLHRGFDPSVEDPVNVGFVSVAQQQGALEVFDRVIGHVDEGRVAGLIDFIVPHTTPGIWRDRGLTPFVSASPNKTIAERYAGKAGEKVATFVVRADQVVTDAFFRYEALVLGAVGPDQVLKVEDAPIKPPVLSQVSFRPSWEIAALSFNKPQYPTELKLK